MLFTTVNQYFSKSDISWKAQQLNKRLYGYVTITGSA